MKATILGVAFAGVITVPAQGQRTLVVDLNGGGAFTAIQAAIDSAEDGDTVLVKAGEYVITESINLKGKSITVKSESGPEATTIRLTTTPVRVVVFDSGETEATVLEGLSLRYSPDSSPAPVGDGGGGDHWTQAGVYCVDSSPTLINCRISVQIPIGFDGGTGFYCTGNSSPSLIGCEISRNSGVGVRFDCPDGGVGACSPSPQLTGCTVSHNVGGGILGGSTSLTITDCAISDNGGSGLSFSGGSLSMNNCTIAGNLSGGLSVSPEFQGSASVRNCIIWGNRESSIDRRSARINLAES